MKKFKWIIWLIIIAAVAAGIWYWQSKKDEKIIVLQTQHPVMGSLTNSVTATGTIQPVDTVAVGTQVSGTIKNVFADFNTTVKKGQLLAQIDKTLFLAQVQQITANLQSAQANLEYQKGNYERQSKLYDVGAISKADLETAQYNYNSAKDNVSSLEAQLKSANQNLSFTDIYSPIDGTVLSRSISAGQTVAASFNTPELFSIAKDLTKMQVQAAVDEADIGNVKPGQRVSFTVDAFPKDTFSGIVKEIRLHSAVSANVVTYTTIIDAPNGDMKLKPGMTATISIYTKEVDNVMLIPASALQFRPDSVLAKIYTIEGGFNGGGNKLHHGRGSKNGITPPSGEQGSDTASAQRALVWLKNDSTLTPHPIMIGMNDETQAQVISGLTLNDLIVTGYSQITKAESNAQNNSPFMPRRPGRNNNRNAGGPPR